MNIIISFTIWFYSFLPDSFIEDAAKKLYFLLHKRHSSSKDLFKKRHPEYRKYSVDPTPPILKDFSDKQKLDFKNSSEQLFINPRQRTSSC